MARHDHVQFYGGIVIQDHTDTDEEVSRGTKTYPITRKTNHRKPVNNAPQAKDDSKKNANGKRGRPRVDPQDENAIEVSSKHLSEPFFRMINIIS